MEPCHCKVAVLVVADNDDATLVVEGDAPSLCAPAESCNRLAGSGIGAVWRKAAIKAALVVSRMIPNPSDLALPTT
jgi:hypothetical protein